MFIDKVYLIVQSGKGGDGIVSFRREKFVPKGGPDGGDGGKGGDIILKVDANSNNLYHLRHTPSIKAGIGGNGKRKNMHGKNGRDIIIKIPPGTILLDEKGEIIYDFVTPDDEKIVAYGGKGGKGNIHFAGPKNRVPEFATEGKEGEKKRIILELKSIADVGIVGYPNVGKSTLLAKISSATPKIANYPFTTLSPNLGVVEFEDFTRLTFADIPGVIDGASSGKGLGFEFLKHIERTKLLLILFDITSKTIVKDYFSILNELRTYNSALVKYPRVIVTNKIDLVEDRIKIPELDEEVLHISALKGTGLQTMLKKILKVIKKIGGANDK